MTCPSTGELTLWVDGALSLTTRAHIDEHIDACNDCFELVAALDETEDEATDPDDASAGVLPSGTVIDRYTILERVGAGGMGIVYAAFDAKLDRRIALKLLAPGAASDRQRADRLAQEAVALAKLAHPNVVVVHDVGVHEGAVFVAMEFVAGVTLRGWLRSATRDVATIVERFVQAGHGLAAAHAAGIVHRDFKPTNVLVANDGRVRVIDFGLAASGPAEPCPDAAPETAKRPGRSLTRTGTVMGTPAYMAPEQARGEATDARSDQYSFCVTLFEALYGVFPESGVDPTATTEKRPESIPAHVRVALRRGLAVLPEDRFSTMSELLAALQPKTPRTSRAPFFLALALVLTAVGAAVIVGVKERDHRRLCTGSEQRALAIWNSERAEDVRAAFGATGLPFAEQAATRVQGLLDGYQRDWVAAHRDSCEATRVRGEQSEATMDLRMQCLERKLLQARVLVETLSRADADVVTNAVGAAQGTLTLAECAPGHVEGRDRREASDPAILEDLLRAEALRGAGKYVDSGRTAKAALEAAEARGQLSLVPEAEEHLARAYLAQSLPSQAETDFFAAYQGAMRLGQQRVAARSAVGMAMTLGVLEERPVDGERWLELAAVAVEALGGDDALSDDILRVRATIQFRANQKSACVDTLRKAARVQESLPGQPLRRAGAATLLGNCLERAKQGDDAEAAYREAIAIYERELGPEHVLLIPPLGNLGQMLHEHGDAERALPFLERGLSISRAQGRNELTWRTARDETNVGSALMALGRHAEARAHLENALALANATPETTAPWPGWTARIHIDLGDLARAEKRTSDALACYDTAIQIDAATGKPHARTGHALLGIGLTHLAAGKGREALAALERARPFCEKEGGACRAQTSMALAQGRWMTGRRDAETDELLRSGREYYAKNPAEARDVAEIEAWFGAHGGSERRSP